MNGTDFQFRQETLTALPSGALWWAAQDLLCVSDLHLGKSGRVARRTGAMLPPYETRDTLQRLSDDIAWTDARRIICLGDSFDDLAAARDLEPKCLDMLATLMAGRDWIWIEGNHDPGPIGLGGQHLVTHEKGPLTFRHIAESGAGADAQVRGEVSGHYHPKARLSGRGRSLSRPCFLLDTERLILPAYGTYTGGLFTEHATLSGLMGPEARALLLPGRGRAPICCPMPRQATRPSSRRVSR